MTLVRTLLILALMLVPATHLYADEQNSALVEQLKVLKRERAAGLEQIKAPEKKRDDLQRTVFVD